MWGARDAWHAQKMLYCNRKLYTTIYNNNDVFFPYIYIYYIYNIHIYVLRHIIPKCIHYDMYIYIYIYIYIYVYVILYPNIFFDIISIYPPAN